MIVSIVFFYRSISKPCSHRFEEESHVILCQEKQVDQAKIDS